MELNELIDGLSRIQNVKTTKNDSFLIVETDLPNFHLEIDHSNIDEIESIISPHGEECLRIYYVDGGGVIVTPNDFVFNVEQNGFVQVNNLPPMCSVREMCSTFERFKSNPLSSDNFDANMGSYYLNYYIFQSALFRGISVPMKEELEDIGKRYELDMEDVINSNNNQENDNIYFVEPVKNKDYTKYIFNGQKYGKNRLVLAVIKDFVENNPTVNYSQLKAKFPDSLQSRETFTTETKAKQKSDRRNFIQPDELIILVDETIAISTQWGIANIKSFIEHCSKMDIEIKL